MEIGPCFDSGLLFTPKFVLDSRQIVGSTAISLSDVAEGVLDNVWLDGGQSFSKLGKAELGVTIKVKSTHDCHELGLEWLMTSTFQKAADRDLVYDLVVLVVNCFEGPSDAESLEFLEVLLELFKTQLKVDLFCE